MEKILEIQELFNQVVVFDSGKLMATCELTRYVSGSVDLELRITDPKNTSTDSQHYGRLMYACVRLDGCYKTLTHWIGKSLVDASKIETDTLFFTEINNRLIRIFGSNAPQLEVQP